MKFKCTCGSKQYNLFRGANYNHAKREPEALDMIDGADIWWEATCEGCGRSWGGGRDYATRQSLTDVMQSAGVLK